MRNYFTYFLILASCLLIISCSQRNIFEKAISKTKLPLGYLHDSQYQKNSGVKQTFSVIVYRNPIIPKTSVTRIGSTVVPAIIYCKNDVLMAGTLGQNSIEQSYATFFRKELNTELMRSNYFSLSDSVKNNGYMLDIAFENRSTVANYHFIAEHVYLFFAILHTYRAQGFPSLTMIQATATLTKGNIEIYKKQYNVSSQEPFEIPGDNKKFRNITRNVQANMVQSLSNTTKKAIDQIIADVYSEIK